jgi:hypothetical protein
VRGTAAAIARGGSLGGRGWVHGSRFLDLADAIGAVDGELAKELLSLAVRLKRMLRALPR